MKDIMNKASSWITTSSDMFKSIEIDDHDINDNNDTLSRYNDEYDRISTASSMKMSSYIFDRSSAVIYKFYYSR